MKSLSHRKLGLQIKNWKWCAFAILLTLLFGSSFVAAIILNTYVTVLERLQMSVSFIALLAFWGLALQKAILRRRFWQVFFFVDSSLFVLGIIFDPEYHLPVLWIVLLFLITIAVCVPYYIGLIIYAFRSKAIWEETVTTSSIPSPQYWSKRWVRRRQVFKKCVYALRLYGVIALVLACMTLIPMIIRNNRMICPWGSPPEHFQHMLKYRRTTIPQLEQFEQLFPRFLCKLQVTETNSNGTGSIRTDLGPGSPVKWSLFAGLHKRYLIAMETDIVLADVDPETGKIASPGAHDEPVFSLWDVKFVDAPLVVFEQRYVLVHHERIKVLTGEEWQQLVNANGDFAALGVELTKDQPIPNFELAFRNNR